MCFLLSYFVRIVKNIQLSTAFNFQESIISFILLNTYYNLLILPGWKFLTSVWIVLNFCTLSQGCGWPCKSGVDSSCCVATSFVCHSRWHQRFVFWFQHLFALTSFPFPLSVVFSKKHFHCWRWKTGRLLQMHPKSNNKAIELRTINRTSEHEPNHTKPHFYKLPNCIIDSHTTA